MKLTSVTPKTLTNIQTLEKNFGDGYKDIATIISFLSDALMALIYMEDIKFEDYFTFDYHLFMKERTTWQQIHPTI